MKPAFGSRQKRVAENKANKRAEFFERFVFDYELEKDAGRCSRGAYQVAKLKLFKAAKAWEASNPQLATLIMTVRLEFMKELEDLFEPNRFSDDKMAKAYIEWKEKK